ncbi:hypothetical protein C8R45DRAFT_936918 [Mycena sanguinolenta]|nr:hypothetical protein C8R45DRAFT_936918 [Mycena sanguinolenta]
MALSLLSASLATVAVESCLYVTSICLLLRGNASSTPRSTPLFRSPIFIGVIGLFLTITAHWVTVVDRAFLGFIQFANPPKFYGDLSQVTNAMTAGLLAATAVIGDALIIHRLWVVWSYNKNVVLFPIATLVGLAGSLGVLCFTARSDHPKVSGIGIAVKFRQYQPGQNVFSSEAGPWITSAPVFTVCLHFAETLESRTYRSTIWWSESETHSNLQLIVIDCLPVITGISCMLIHVRIGMGWARTGGEHRPTLSGTQLSSFAVNITPVRHTNIEGFDCPTDEEQNKGMV